jgi:pyruvate dehydrogenase (quinone)
VLGSAYQQEVDLLGLVKDVSAQSAQTVTDPVQAQMVLDRAFRTALATRSPTVVILPHDVQQEPLPDDLPHTHGVIVTAPEFRRPRVVPYPEDLEEAVDVLSAGRKVALLVGQGARHAAEQVVAVAERLGAGIATSLLGKPYVDESLPFVTGVMGHLGTTASAYLLGNCDTLLIVGSNDPWTEYYPPPGRARAVQVDLDGRHVGNRYPVEVEREVRAWHTLAEERAHLPAHPLNPELVVRSLSARLPVDAMVSVDVGSVTYWYARHLRLPPGVPAHLSSTLASMGSALPYGLAAKLAEPYRPLIALAGDGAMQMNGLAELITVSHRWERWSDPRFVVCVLHNGDPRFADSQPLPAFPYARYADLLGLRGIRVDDPADVGAAWDAALAADRPVVLEAVVDADVPLLPPFPSGEQKLESFSRGLEQERSLRTGRHVGQVAGG